MFVTLEDETGFANFVVMPDVQQSFRETLLRAPLLLLDGTVESEQGVVNVMVSGASPLASRAGSALRSRDFR
jgi:error-prone DNA polymerase